MVAISYHCFLDVLEFRNVGTVVVVVAAAVVAMVVASAVALEDDTMVV